MADNKNFSTYIKKVVSSEQEDAKLSGDVKVYLNNLCIYFIKKVGEYSNLLMNTKKTNTVQENVVKGTSLLVLDNDDFGEKIVSKANETVELFLKNKYNNEMSSVAERSGLIFPPTKVHYYFSKYCSRSRMRYSETSKILLCSIVENLIRFIVSNSLPIMNEKKHKTLTLPYVTNTIFKSKVLKGLLKNIDSLLPNLQTIDPFLSFKVPKTKKDQMILSRPKPEVKTFSLLEGSSLVNISRCAIKRIGYRAGLRRFGEQVEIACLLNLYEEVKKLVKICLVSTNHNNRRTIYPIDVSYALTITQGGCLLTPLKKFSVIAQKTVKEKKSRTTKSQQAKTKEWEKKVVYYQNLSNKLFLARDSFRRLVEEALGTRIYTEDVDIQSTIGVEKTSNLNKNALDMLQYHCENYIVRKLQMANKIAIFNNRQTVQKEDVYIAFKN